MHLLLFNIYQRHLIVVLVVAKRKKINFGLLHFLSASSRPFLPHTYFFLFALLGRLICCCLSPCEKIPAQPSRTTEHETYKNECECKLCTWNAIIEMRRWRHVQFIHWKRFQSNGKMDKILEWKMLMRPINICIKSVNRNLFVSCISIQPEMNGIVAAGQPIRANRTGNETFFFTPK